MDLKKKLLAIQQELKAPKERRNKFGGYGYRSTEDILAALKPLLKKHDVVLTITDKLELIGERYYIKASASLVDVAEDSCIIANAYARETLERKKYDDSQLTGAASSYARKYALQGLFLIDDNSDADAMDDDPAELDRQEAEEQEPVQDIADHDRYYYIESQNNVVVLKAGVPKPEGGEEITELQYRAAFMEIARNGKKADIRAALAMADAMNVPEAPEGVEAVPYQEEQEEEKPRTRRTRRKRA